MRVNGEQPFMVPQHPQTPTHLMMNDYKDLIDKIRERNPSATILVSSIIPEYFDWDHGKAHLITINNGLKNLCATYRNLEYIPTYKCMLKGGNPVKENYYGSIIVKRFFNRKIAEALSKLI